MSSMKDLVDCSVKGGSVLENPLIMQGVFILIVIIILVTIFRGYIWPIVGPVVEPVYTYVLKPVGGVLVSAVKKVM